MNDRKLKENQAEFFEFTHEALTPYRAAKSLAQTVIIILFVLGILIFAPFYALFEMWKLPRDANKSLTSNPDSVHVLVDFSTNTFIAMPQSGQAYITTFPSDMDYKSPNARWLGSVPGTWGFGNTTGFLLGDDNDWIRGKSAPLYAAYASAAITSDALRDMLSHVGEHTTVLHDAPKVGMIYIGSTVFGLCPAEHCTSDDFRLHEARDLFTPSVSAGQAQAIAELQYTTTDEYWLREAHLNGFYSSEDDFVRSMAARNRDKLAGMFHSAPSIGEEVLIAIELIVLLLVLFGIFKLCRFIFC